MIFNSRHIFLRNKFIKILFLFFYFFYLPVSIQSTSQFRYTIFLKIIFLYKKTTTKKTIYNDEQRLHTLKSTNAIDREQL